MIYLVKSYKMTFGYLYCFSNDSMPGILMIGSTDLPPDLKLEEANTYDSWKPPTPYKIEIAKRVMYPRQKKMTIYKILDQYTSGRVNKKQEFFYISLEEVKAFFELIDGDYWLNDPFLTEHENKNILRCS